MSKVWGLMADLHLHPWSAFASTNADGVNNRLAGLLSEMERCAGEVKAAGGNLIVIAGDVFHVRGSVSPTVLNATRDMMKKTVEELGVVWVVMPGNHDLEGKETTRISSAVTSLEMTGVHVISEPKRLGSLGNLLLIPWVERAADLKVMLQAENIDKDTDLILHAPIDGVIEGLPLHGIEPAFLASLGARRVFAGHYHNHKAFPGGVYSIGALAHHTWSDVKSSAGFLLVSDTQVEWRQSRLPQFIDLDNLVETDPTELSMAVDHNYVRVKVETSKTAEVEAARKELLDMGALGVIVQAKPKPASRPLTASGAIASVSSGASLEVSVNDFVAAKLGSSPRVEKIKQAALDVLSAV